MYYIGFLKKDARHAMVFKSIKTPQRDDMTYFVKVMGPYATERTARSRVNLIKRYGYRENPIADKVISYAKRGIRAYEAFQKENPAQVISHKQALSLTKKIIIFAKKLYKHEKAGVKKNPASPYHERQFRTYMNDLEKYKIGSVPYITALAKAYENLKAIQEIEKGHKIMRMKVR